eukprot:CAMPEP_0172492350 /NCGR_PEP_ID=MMETSP1066-20121228/23473_1 /TAXON_ID=671091 /ORGANISM="Coscinodiscus wailesii, Strain CCMP2513" /LENGTH=259 /DNA_ID=CAMNT_0013261917 /DNA_START=1 /DNA_END=777 /DNA_ORIENTATION=-
MLTESLKFPKMVPTGSTESGSFFFQFGANFDGQASALYVFKDYVSDNTFQALLEATAGTVELAKGSDKNWDEKKGQVAKSANAITRQTFVVTEDDIGTAASGGSGGSSRLLKGQQQYRSRSTSDVPWEEQEDELLNTISPNNDLSTVNFGSKLLFVWDPIRTSGNVIFEAYYGAHAAMDESQVQPWIIDGPKDVIGNIGGVSILLPMFQSLLSLKNEAQPLSKIKVTKEKSNDNALAHHHPNRRKKGFSLPKDLEKEIH